MLELAKTLSRGLPHLRTDFYLVGDKIYFGELTLYSGDGMGKWWPNGFDTEIGNWLSIEELKS